MLRNLFSRSAVLAAVLLVPVCLLSAASAHADEPQMALVALLFPISETPPECLDDPIGIAFGAGPGSNSTQKTLSSTFEEPFRNENLNPRRALYVSQAGVRNSVVYSFGGALPPNGFMRLGPNSDAEVLFCGRVTNNSGILEPDQEAEFLLVIVGGAVR